MELFENTFIPIHKKGKQLDLEHSVTKNAVDDAGELYRAACRRLLYPFLWHDLAGIGTAEFNIYEKESNGSKPLEINDHLVINIPGADLIKTESHDWVIVEDIKQNVIKQADASIGLKLRACAAPGTPEDSTDHFFTEAATSTLIIKRIENVVTASYHGRNEQPNIETGDIVTNIRNGVVALGAIIGLSKMQWAALIKGLLSDQM